MSSFSFATKKASCKKLELIESKEDTNAAAPPSLTFKIVSASLTANNKFYLGFGEKAPFHFFKIQPVPEDSKLVDSDSASTTGQDYVHPPVWGVAEVTQSNMDEIPVGAVFRAMLPLGTEVHFEKAHVDPTLGDLIVHRPGVLAAYNTFAPIPKSSVCHPTAKNTSGLALTCFPGILTGFGLYFALKRSSFHDCDTIVVTSASCKVALAFALYMKDTAGKRVIGFTSESNKKFCEATGLYSTVLGYEEALPETDKQVVMIDISGRGALYTKYVTRVKKLFCIGSTADVADKDSTFAGFTAYAKVKMILTMMGGPKAIRKRMNPTQELFLIMDVSQELLAEWGKAKYLETVEEYTKNFCDEAGKWMEERKCETEDSIRSSFEGIIQGTVKPSEYIVLDVAKALAHRK